MVMNKKGDFVEFMQDYGLVILFLVVMIILYLVLKDKILS